MSKFNDISVKLLQSKIMEKVKTQIQMTMMRQQLNNKEDQIEKITMDKDMKARELSDFMGELAQLCPDLQEVNNRDEITYQLSEKLQSYDDKNKLLSQALDSKKEQN